MSQWSVYPPVRFMLNALDVTLYVLEGVTLIKSGQSLTFGVLAEVLTLLGVLAALAEAVVRLHGKAKAWTELISSSVQSWTFTFEGLVTSAPGLVMNLVLLFSEQDVYMKVNESTKWYDWMVLPVIVSSMMVSLCSVELTMFHFNEQELPRNQKQAIKTITAFISNSLSLFVRIFVFASLMTIQPTICVLLILAIFAINSGMYFLVGQILDMAWLAGYAALFSPFGCSKSHILGHAMLEEVSQCDREKVSLLHEIKLCKRSHGLFAVVSILLLIPHVALMETQSGKDWQNDLADIWGSGIFVALYATPILLSLIAIIFSLLYVGQTLDSAQEELDRIKRQNGEFILYETQA